MTAPDLVWIVRPGANPELRYSIRSFAANLARFGRIWIVGTVPEWARDIRGLPLAPRQEKFANQRQSVTAVVDQPDLSDTFWLLNDDHFLVEPVDELPVFHGPRTSEYMADLDRKKVSPRNTWRSGVAQTAAWMEQQGFPDPICYELHVPLPYDKARLRDVLDRYPADQRFCYPGVYPIAGAGGEGELGINCKVRGNSRDDLAEKSGGPYLSSNDVSFQDGEIGRHVRAMFPDPCHFEAR